MKYNNSTHIDKDLLEDTVKNSKNKSKVFEKLNMKPQRGRRHNILNYFLMLYNIDTSHFKYEKTKKKQGRIAIEDIFAGKFPFYSSSALGKRLVKEGYCKRECTFCHLTEWQGKPIPLDLDHINGNSTDHRLENVRLLCRNCHAQTDTFCGRKKKKITS